ncbi:MAG: M64 family metallopeptidase [Candidatus Micrarchaeota archaeon]|nr:M64 family metallopeptidase [Candidatus Micrarchaeota archaeon]
MKTSRRIFLGITIMIILISGCCNFVTPKIPIDDETTNLASDINDAAIEINGMDNAAPQEYDKIFNDSITDKKLFDSLNYTEQMQNSGNIYSFPRNREISANWCDSDDGYSIYEKGGAGNYNDECINQNELSELVCMDDFNTWLSYEHYCGEGCYNGACNSPTLTAVASQCKPVIAGQNNISNENRINIVFVGFNYETKDDFTLRVKKSLSWDSDETRGIFAIEPFHSNKDKFNLWYVDKLFDINLGQIARSDSYGALLSDDQRQMLLYYDNEISSACGFNNRITMGLLNDYGISYANVPNHEIEKYTGALSNGIILYPDDKTADKISDCQDDYTCSWYRNFYLNDGSPVAVTHEFGHAFGGLNDEYDLQLLTVNTSNKYTNCIRDNSINNIQQCLKNAPWKDILGMGCGDPKKIDCTPDNPNYELEVSCYEGCDYQSAGVFRPTLSSLMSTSTNRTWFDDKTNNRIYGPVNERIICCRMLYYTGEAGGTCIDYNENGLDLLGFCSKYKEANGLK